ncbi:PREDICTED: uncharacterized protein C2orf61 homolog [Elephantulus edwardii]|uniref:uncharacterized protein C2orf61 homolog n=1 Tax=Elephantulus edwardii TaxID=28737 RepID=UPI0003F0DF52|nr:PREDICTED: uncharacterized protein C2orf61 homolog [Elephantulus edwardii]
MYSILKAEVSKGSVLSTQDRKSTSLEREGWWRITLTNTPKPGTYHLRTFIEESLLNPIPATYNFKNEGRRKPPLVHRNNPVMTDLPHYIPPNSMDLLKKQMATYSFKDKPRASPSTLVFRDQTIQLAPGQYEIIPPLVPKSPARDVVFHSTVPRFSSGWFIPHEGPGPGHYDLKAPATCSVTSCFQSRVPRFLTARSKTPGPGAYTASVQYPKQSPSVARMGREHSLFFNNTIGF